MAAATGPRARTSVTPMIQTALASWPLLLGIALLMLGNGLQGSLLGVRADLEGFPTAATGMVMSAFYLGLLSGSLATPLLIGRVGHVRVFAAFAAIASAAVLLHAVVVAPIFWIGVRAVAGFSFAALFIVAESWLNSQAANRDRARLLSLYMIITFGGMGLGQLLLNVADPRDFQLFVLVSILLSVAVVPMLLTASPAPAAANARRLGPVELFRVSPLGVAGSFASGAAIGAVLGMGAVFGAQSGLGVGGVAQFMFAVLVAGMLGQLPIGYLADHLDRRPVLIVTALAGSALALAGALLGGSAGLALVVALSLVAFPLYSVSVAHTNDHLETEAMVGAAGGLMFVNGVGAAFGPFAASLAMSAFGPLGFQLYLAMALGGLAVFGIYRTFQRGSVPLAEQGPTVPMSVATSLAQTTAVDRLEPSPTGEEQVAPKRPIVV